ncbi:MAG: hypothetical protein AB8B55_15185 [Mariniblastus sp.]
MTILFSCPHCAKTANLPKHFAGKTVKCKCGERVVVDTPPAPGLDLGAIQYEAVDDPAPLANSKVPANPITRVRQQKLKKENKVLSNKLGRNWRNRPNSQYQAGQLSKSKSWVKDVKETVQQGPVQAFWAFAFGVLLLCFGIHMASWGSGEIGVSESAGYISSVLVRFSFLFIVFGGFVASCGFSIVINALLRREIRQDFDNKTITSLIGGTSLLIFILLGFTTWILMRNAGLGATSVDNFGTPLGQGETNLVMRVAAPQAFEAESTLDDPNATWVTYPSGNASLKAILWMPEKVKGTHPVVIYLHDGHALEPSVLKQAEHFHKNNMIVMCPSFRGENGNPGYFELIFGEVNDAVSAVNWIAEQPNVNRSQIYVFGYGVGGGVSALMSLQGETKVQMTASCSGLYQSGIFQNWPGGVPFNVHNQWESNSRVLLGRIAQMKQPHIAYLGHDDLDFKNSTDLASKETALLPTSMLTVRPVDGNHQTSLRNAVRAFESYIHARQ